MNKIVVVVCGGVVTSVFAKEDLEVVLIDRDDGEAEGITDEEMDEKIANETKNLEEQSW